jgi:hypothetical protein
MGSWRASSSTRTVTENWALTEGIAGMAAHHRNHVAAPPGRGESSVLGAFLPVCGKKAPRLTW